jgi:glutamate racemase
MGAIGVLDSGVGGLSVLHHLREQLPHEDFIYLADQAHIPYGPRPQAEIQKYTAGIIRFLINKRAKLIVVACNTASAAALEFLRKTFPHIPIVGMEPAVKPAASITRSGRVGVLATPGTFNSHRYASLMARYAGGIEVSEDPCPGLVQLIEDGALDSAETRRLLEDVVGPMISSGVDTLVLGCTHYPFILPLLREVTGEVVAIIDPAPAVARHTRNVLQQNNLATLASQDGGQISCYTSGRIGPFNQMVQKLLGFHCQTKVVCWRESFLSDEC